MGHEAVTILMDIFLHRQNPHQRFGSTQMQARADEDNRACMREVTRGPASEEANAAFIVLCKVQRDQDP